MGGGGPKSFNRKIPNIFFPAKIAETKDVGFFNGFHLGENGPHASSHGHVQDTPRDNE